MKRIIKHLALVFLLVPLLTGCSKDSQQTPSFELVNFHGTNDPEDNIGENLNIFVNDSSKDYFIKLENKWILAGKCHDGINNPQGFIFKTYKNNTFSVSYKWSSYDYESGRNYLTTTEECENELKRINYTAIIVFPSSFRGIDVTHIQQQSFQYPYDSCKSIIQYIPKTIKSTYYSLFYSNECINFYSNECINKIYYDGSYKEFKNINVLSEKLWNVFATQTIIHTSDKIFALSEMFTDYNLCCFDNRVTINGNNEISVPFFSSEIEFESRFYIGDFVILTRDIILSFDYSNTNISISQDGYLVKLSPLEPGDCYLTVNALNFNRTYLIHVVE